MSREHTHKEKVGVWTVAGDAEEFHEIEKLAMDVSTDGNGAGLEKLAGVDWWRRQTYHDLHVGFAGEDFFCLGC